MYSVGVRDHIMVAHSLPGEVFGPAQRLHGATYTVTAELSREELNDSGIVVDIGELQRQLHGVLAELHYQNLDEHPAFKGKRSTTELIARHVMPHFQGQARSTLDAAERARAARPELAGLHAKAVEAAGERYAKARGERAH